MRAQTIMVEGDAAAWDPEGQGPFRALARSQFLRVEYGNAVCLTADGREQTVYPGWLVISPDDGGRALFAAPDQARVVGGG